MFHTDICIAGAGVIGLSLALELNERGLSVVVLDRGQPMREASTAAAGMLAADDPHNPPELNALAHFSVSLYPSFLQRLFEVGGVEVRFQTTHTLQSRGLAAGARGLLMSVELVRALLGNGPSGEVPGFEVLEEHSVDPQQLGASLLAAVSKTRIRLVADSPGISTRVDVGSVTIETSKETIAAAQFVDCRGAWAGVDPGLPAYTVIPIKGQMLAVAIPAGFPLRMTVRTRDLYIVPRTFGPNAGRAIIGATVEDVGFDKGVRAEEIAELHRKAARLLPQFEDAEILDSWAGLRPATLDRLPLLGGDPGRARHWVATGHYRNGILLAPGTARVMADLLLDETPDVVLDAFAPSRAMVRGSARPEHAMDR